MTTKNSLEHSGNLSKHPFAELLVEIVHAKFSGSLRISNSNDRAIVYFRGGEVIYAVSNSKALRLFNLLLRKKLIDTKVIAGHSSFANDLEFSAALISNGVLSREQVEEVQKSQIEDIVIDILTWPAGEWVFSPLVRVRDEMSFPIDLHRILIDYARCASSQHVLDRFKSVQESFSKVAGSDHHIPLQQHEVDILRNFDKGSMTIEELRKLTPMPESGLLQALYVLWLGGLLNRRDWNVAFSPTKIGEILTARIARVKGAADVDAPIATRVDEPTVQEEDAAPEPEPVKLPETTLSLEEYLTQIESAETHYDALGIPADSDPTRIKHAYFSLAKQFHPDRHHRESAQILRRIQSAFTLLASAHETLKSSESREAYDARMKKEIDAREKRRAAGQPDSASPLDRKAEQGLESFEEGLNMLNDEEYEAAVAYLGRAVHYSPQNALFQAYFGLALYRSDEKNRHKAESAMQTAVKLDPKNAKIRMILVDFLIEQKMMKRAEGELKRFLELVPNNKEASSLLAKVRG